MKRTLFRKKKYPCWQYITINSSLSKLSHQRAQIGLQIVQQFYKRLLRLPDDFPVQLFRLKRDRDSKLTEMFSPVRKEQSSLDKACIYNFDRLCFCSLILRFISHLDQSKILCLLSFSRMKNWSSSKFRNKVHKTHF